MVRRALRSKFWQFLSPETKGTRSEGSQLVIAKKANCVLNMPATLFSTGCLDYIAVKLRPSMHSATSRLKTSRVPKRAKS